MKENDIMASLKAPFKPEDIEWKPQSATERNGQISVLVVPYLNARAIMDRLDEVCGPMWKSEFEQMSLNTAKGTKQGFSCRLAIKIGEEWIARVDGAEVSDIESIKGGHSNALKRAAVQWGIGRYLYELPNFWVPLNKNGSENVNGDFKIGKEKKWIKGRYDAPRLPTKFLPAGYEYQKNSSQRQESPPSEQTITTQSQQSKAQAGKPSDRVKEAAKKSPLEITCTLFNQLKIQGKHVPVLFQRVVGSKITAGQASEDQLRAVVKALKPVKAYLDYCNQIGLSEEEMLDYAQITVKEKLDNPLNLILKMDSDICNETTKLIHEDRKSVQTA